MTDPTSARTKATVMQYTRVLLNEIHTYVIISMITNSKAPAGIPSCSHSISISTTLPMFKAENLTKVVSSVEYPKFSTRRLPN